MNVGFPAISVLHEYQKNGTHEKADDHGQGLEKIGINEVFEQKAQNRCRKHTDDQGDTEVQPFLLSFEEGLRHGEKLVPVEDDDGKDGAQLNHYVEHSGERILRKPDEVSRQNHMSCGRYGYKLRKAFHDGDHDGLKYKINIQNNFLRISHLSFLIYFTQILLRILEISLKTSEKEQFAAS